MKRYKANYSCVICDQPLSFNEVMYSGGVCPYCGEISEGTVVRIKKTVKEVEYKGVLGFLQWITGT